MTTTKTRTLQEVLSECELSELADALRKVDLGRKFSVIKAAFTVTTGASTFDITSALAAAGLTSLSGIPALTGSQRLPGIAHIRSLRIVAAGTATFVGSYVLGSKDATVLTAATSSVVGLCLISDDGSTITFPTSTVTGIEIEYIPLSGTDLTSEFAPKT